MFSFHFDVSLEIQPFPWCPALGPIFHGLLFNHEPGCHTDTHFLSFMDSSR